MAALPAILTCRTAAEVQAVLRAASGQAGLAFAPTHLIGPDIRGGIAYDLVGDWHLYAEDGGAASRIRMPHGQSSNFWRWAMRTQAAGRQGWASRTLGQWSFTGEFSLLLILACYEPGGGGLSIGNLKGPDVGNPHSPTGVSFGADRGWAISLNGDTSISGIGFGIYGDEAGANPRLFRPNIDTNSDGSSNIHDGVFRPFFLGMNVAAGHGYLRGPSANFRVQEDGTPGNTSSPDGLMAVGRCDYYGQKLNYGSMGLALLASFEGATAQNCHTHGANITAALQTQLTAGL